MAAVAIVDMGIGNLRSVQKAVERAAEGGRVAWEAVITSDPDTIARADKVIVPGQGAFRDCAAALGRGIGASVRAQIERGTPFLGICLGLQALFESSEESPGSAGLALFRGTNVRLPDGQRDPSTGEALKIPHMGWNRIELEGGGHPFLAAAGGEGTYFYFTHSFHAVPADTSLLAATARHGPMHVTAAVAKDNVFASQFHPEKSQGAGLRLLAAFLGH
jgi:glutamine amidotransferase